MPCAIGLGGRRPKRGEGDGITPKGIWAIRGVLYRADRRRRPATALPVRAIRSDDGWCDDPADRNYNRGVRLPYGASHERLWRGDHLYDVVVILGYNDVPRSLGRGSAIFLHLARRSYKPTQGCIALSRADMDRVLRWLRPGDRVVVP
jgi:L,D-peptidoglycan transpeptidase YkuD (ErfK/YbiS/YcfS/YnhG family)